ncbi:MAG: hypothetical protein N2037_05195 [Acidimicrobiales bacterium]|nr:hypothetical protein [Acidimicrobiales bacterium]
MSSLAEEKSSSSVVLVDASVVRDIAAALNGIWRPADEEDAARARRLVAVARLRLYASRDRNGWLLVTTDAAREAAMRRGDADWSVGYLPTIESFSDAPPPAEVASLARLFREEEGIEAESAFALAHAILNDNIEIVVTDDPGRYKHLRRHDLPPRLELLDPFAVEERLEILPGEKPGVTVPEGVLSLLGDDPWWIPNE